jgi:miniconductance mechanosensitive channel
MVYNMNNGQSALEYIHSLLLEKGVSRDLSRYLSWGILAVILVVVCILANMIIRKIIIRMMDKIVKMNNSVWGEILHDRKLFPRMANMVPGIIVYSFAPAFGGHSVSTILQMVSSTYILVIVALIIGVLLDTIDDIYRTYPVSLVRPIKGFLQVIKIVADIIIGIWIVANLMGESPLILLGGVGAVTAVISFVFKDSILGFIAGVQLTSNDMLRIGDWIEMPKYGADGEVIDVTLNTVKIQNFDKTIITVPAYVMVSDSFKNWRGMQEFGGRRIKRSVYIDVNSIRFCTPEMIEKFKNIEYLKDYIIEMENNINAYNQKHPGDANLLANGRHMSNIGTFRIYIQKFLENFPGLYKNTMQMVRQLPPGEYGLPIEIYAFTDDTDWDIYERIQADIFDHIFSVVGEFGLRIFQNPTGHDLRQVNSNNHNPESYSGQDIR